MSEERLQEIKDSVDFQREMLLVHNLGTLCVDEEQELIDEIERLKEEYIMLQNAGDEVEEEKDREIERLNNIINELEQWLESEIDRIIKLKSPKRRSIPPLGEENCYYENMILRYKEVLDKLRELKGSDK